MYTVYSKPACTYCDQAKSLLASKGLPYTEINIDVGQPKEEGALYLARDEFLATFPGVRMLPLILRDDTKVGGFLELKQELKV